jgi:hypothetical protein
MPVENLPEQALAAFPRRADDAADRRASPAVKLTGPIANCAFFFRAATAARNHGETPACPRT